MAVNTPLTVIHSSGPITFFKPHKQEKSTRSTVNIITPCPNIGRLSANDADRARNQTKFVPSMATITDAGATSQNFMYIPLNVWPALEFEMKYPTGMFDTCQLSF